ncbi:uncharacterized protein SEPMUDRAFT_148352 [Sphaerulina musiva SO2202]|uniref:Uncharacterized protein n=1 Tax=Sphaerulina musiva (strain SO2202) TaxID=692275 RepID=M3D9B0_SPHMS|nr:uncharacterized protein SEPMUDRAFT_148352 [Sphaerulina musiva SO2202]EMF14720.1 hypothetical protein SEPMUDRAFT_148352 [Sphaerulina musiva SO2202]
MPLREQLPLPSSIPPPPPLHPAGAISPHNSSTPLISERQREDQRDVEATPTALVGGDSDGKSLKRRLLDRARRKQDDDDDNNNNHNINNMQTQMEAANTAAFETAASAADVHTTAPLGQQKVVDASTKPRAQRTPVSPSRLPYHSTLSASPSRLRSTSPRLHSPASSEIFERNVQEPIPISTLGSELTDAHIPAHVMTEDDIPPALDASAEAITSKSLNPDQVEIVMSTAHQPAAASVLEGSLADLSSLHSQVRHDASLDSETASSLHASSILPSLDDDVASNYGQLDPTDVRRLSFISFKDIVHSEHQQQQYMAGSGLGEVGSRDSLHIGGHSFSSSINERAASPLRSPRSPTSSHSQTVASGGLATPPPGGNVVNPSLEQSPVRFGSPGSLHGAGHGELTIETMRQTIRKTASGDLSSVRQREGSDGHRGAGMSPVSDEIDLIRQAQSRSRANS